MGRALRGVVLCVVVLAALSGCAGVVDSPYASDEFVRAKSYSHPGPPSISVLTVVSNRSGSGAHSALLINGSERVIFDPAGSFKHEIVPERDDVLFGITPAVLQGYRSAHARSTYHIVTQTIDVSPEQAELALRLAKANGPVPRAFCAQATSGLLRQVPGFSEIRQGMFPSQLMEQIEARGDAETTKYFEDDEGGIVDGVANLQL